MGAIGIDIGSTNVKAVLVDGDGLVRASAAMPLHWERRGDVAEQDAEALWQAVVSSLVAVAASAGTAAMRSVDAIGVCGQYSSIVPVDAQVRPLAPMRLYLDQRGTPHCHHVLGAHEAAFETWLARHPIPPVGGGLALGHLLGFQLDAPDVHAVTAAYLEPVDYVSARLTGVITATQASMFASQLIDNRRLDQLSYDVDLVAMAGVDASRLPALVPIGSVVGEVRSDVAAASGLPGGVAVCTGITDSCAQALATGASGRNRVGLAIGTTGVVLSSVDALGMDPDHEVLAMPGVEADRYLVSAENGIAGRAVAHVMDRFIHGSDALGDHSASDPFTGFDAALTASPAGSGGVLFLPWMSGSMAPQADSSVRGGFVGLSLDTDRVDLVRAAAEGVAHNLRWLLGPVETFTGERADEVILTGGAARSAVWCQIIADVLGRPVRVLADPINSGALAAARWAVTSLVASGTEDLMAAVGKTFEPDESTDAVHGAQQERFASAFGALRPLRLGDAPG